MDNLLIAATATSPLVDFRFDEHLLTLKGESYPENAAAFYSPILQSLRDYLAQCEGQTVTADIHLAYFNSSSTKMLFSLFDALNEAAEAGNTVQLNWYHDAEDETIFEFGEELQTDFTALSFTDHPLTL